MGCGRSAQRPKRSETALLDTDLAVNTVKSGPESPRSALSPKSLYPPTDRPLLSLDFAYGCSQIANSQFLFYLSTTDLVAYPCGGLIVLLTISSNAQQFLGGGEIHCARGHSGQVVAMTANRERSMLASSDCSATPLLCIWRLPDTEPITEISLVNSAIEALAFSWDSRTVLGAENSPQTVVRGFQIRSGAETFRVSAALSAVSCLSCSPSPSLFCTINASTLYFWSWSNGTYIYKPMQCSVSMVQAAWLSSGQCVSAGSDGRVYLWTQDSVQTSLQVLNGNTPVTALTVREDCVLVGGSDGLIHVLDSKFRESRTIAAPGAVISVDMARSGVLCATSEGILIEYGKSGRTVLMDTSFHGDFPSFALDPRQSSLCAMTSGNSIHIYDFSQRKSLSSGLIESVFPVSQSCFAAISPQGLLAIGHADGHVTIRRSVYQFNSIVYMDREDKGRVTVMRFARDGGMLAVGRENGSVTVYESGKKYGRKRNIAGDTAEITAIDWGSGRWLRVKDSEHRVQRWNCDSGEKTEDKQGLIEQAVEQTIVEACGSPFPSTVTLRSELGLLVQGTAHGHLELLTGEHISAYSGHGVAVTRLGLSAQRVVSLGANGSLLLWKLS